MTIDIVGAVACFFVGHDWHPHGRYSWHLGEVVRDGDRCRRCGAHRSLFESWLAREMGRR